MEVALESDKQGTGREQAAGLMHPDCRLPLRPPLRPAVRQWHACPRLQAELLWGDRRGQTTYDGGGKAHEWIGYQDVEVCVALMTRTRTH